MKLRAIMLVDLEMEGFIEIAQKQQELQALLDKLKAEDPDVVDVLMDFKERRGNSMPDLKNMKLRGA